MSDDRPMSDVRRVPSWIYTDPDVFQEEKQRIFATTWNLLGHESELREPGDFTVRYIADDSILIVRGEDGNLRGFHNVCRHRGMQVCRADLGNTKRFTCAYHGWLYDRAGRLVGVPLDKPHFGEQGINRDEHSLLPIARLDTCEGFIFGALSRDAGSLADYLGDFAWYMAIQSRRDPAGLEVIGEPQRWIVKGNWKSGAENAMGDSYHAQFTHRSVMEIGVHPNHLSDFQGRGSRNGIHVDTGRATIAFARQSPMERGYPPSMVEQFQANLPSAQRALIFDHGPVWPTRAAVFPNLMFLNAGAYIAAERLVPFFFCRVWRPLRADAIEVWNWVLVERGATEEFKQDSQRAFVLTFGPAG
ncbi:MAG: aromatic ring-hydroxylating dioxygenase subunit alpha, partial [Ilumatobacteraceae bacterium]